MRRVEAMVTGYYVLGVFLVAIGSFSYSAIGDWRHRGERWIASRTAGPESPSICHDVGAVWGPGRRLLLL